MERSYADDSRNEGIYFAGGMRAREGHVEQFGIDGIGIAGVESEVERIDDGGDGIEVAHGQRLPLVRAVKSADDLQRERAEGQLAGDGVRADIILLVVLQRDGIFAV